MPSREYQNGVAADVLRSLDDQVDEMLDSWTNSILDSLDDPITHENLDLLQADEKSAVQQLINQRSIALPIDLTLVAALKTVLGGLMKVSIKAKDLESALQSGGPAKLEDLKQRFTEYIDSIAQGKDPKKIRIVLE